jgi:hypothetical protein
MCWAYVPVFVSGFYPVFHYSNFQVIDLIHFLLRMAFGYATEPADKAASPAQATQSFPTATKDRSRQTSAWGHLV